MENKKNRDVYQRHSFKTLFQIQLAFLISNLLDMVFGNMMLFYTTIVLLPIELFVINSLIYMIWNMFNDPILGHLCDKSTRWTEKYGKRFPFIVIGVIGSAISLIFVFFVPIPDPSMNPILVFLWLLVILCIYDTFFAIFAVNIQSLFQYKVRSNEDRMKSGVILILTGSIGMILSIILQPVIVSLFGIETIFAWTLQATVFAGIIILVLIAMIPGIRESKELREHRLKLDSKEQIPFFKALFTAIKSRSYDAYMIAMVSYGLTVSIVVSSLSYFVIYVLGLDITYTIIPMVLIMILAPISAPIWYKLGKKYGSKNVYSLSFILIGALFLPFLFVQDYNLLVIIFVFFGAAFGCNGVMQHPIDADVIEEATTKTGTRNEGIYNGIQTFFVTLPVGLSVTIMGTIQILTGFDPTSAVQTDLALLGLRLLISIVPMIILGIGVIIFWVLYDITPEKREIIQAKLKEMEL